jgi:hypothetical protein
MIDHERIICSGFWPKDDIARFGLQDFHAVGQLIQIERLPFLEGRETFQACENFLLGHGLANRLLLGGRNTASTKDMLAAILPRKCCQSHLSSALESEQRDACLP